MRPKTSILIVNYNTRELLKNCLASTLRQEQQDIELIVVDNHSSDESATMVRAEFPSVLLIENLQNLGFAKANNCGIKEARGEYVLLLNSDTIVRPGAIQSMEQFLDSHPETGAVACRLVYADGRIQASVGRQAGPALTRQILRLSGISGMVRSESIRRLLRKYLGFAIGSAARSYLDPYVTDTPIAVESISGACLMLRRQAMNQVGLLDENFFMYSEDLDYCLRLRKAGWKLYYVPTGEIVHLVGQSSGGRMRRYSVHAYRSLLYFYQKHYSAWSVYVIRLAVFLSMSVRWTWNFVSGVFSNSPGRRENRSDLAKLIRLSWTWRAAEMGIRGPLPVKFRDGIE
jgi:GT2 family glycosyltransferase